MTRSHLGASRRLPPRITMLSTPKYKWKEERKRVLKLSVKKLRSIEDPEAFLSRSVLINNTLKRLQTEVREEKSIKKANSAAAMMHMMGGASSTESSDSVMTSMTSEVSMCPTYSPSPYSFYSIEKAYREEVERLDNNNGMNQLCTRDTSGFVNHHHHHHGAEAVLQEDKVVLDVVHDQDDDDDSSHMFEADDEASEDSEEEEEEASVTSGSEDSSESASEDDNEELEQNFTKEDIKNVAISDRIVPPSSAASLEDELLSDMPPPSLPPPPQMMLEEIKTVMTSVADVSSVLTSGSSRLEAAGLVEAIINNPSAEAVMKSSECCDNEDLYSEAVRTECWTKPSTPTTTPSPSPPSTPPTTLSTSSRTTSPLSSTSSAVNNTWPNLEWPTYVPSMTGLSSSPMTGLMSSTGLASANASSGASSVMTSFSPNISAVVPMCSSHKENLFQMPNAIADVHHRSSQIEKCYSCAGQASSLFQSELQSVSVFNSLITSLET